MNRLRYWLARLLVAFVATMLSAKAGDWALGLVRSTHQRHLLRLPPNVSYRHRTTEYDYVFRTNSHGLRGPDRPLAKPPGVRRIVVLGDSFVAGYGVADEELFTTKLEKMLGTTAGSEIEVINVGRAGTSTIRESDLYTLVGRQFHPDLVILAYFLGNDLREVVDEHDRDELARWRPQGAVRRLAYALCPNVYLELAMIKQAAAVATSSQPRTEEQVLAALRRECDVHQADYESARAAYRRLPADIRTQLAEGRLSEHLVFKACYDPGRLRQALAPDDAFFHRAWPRTAQHLELLRQAVRADGADFIVIIIPDAVQVDPAAQKQAAILGYEVDPAWLSGRFRVQDALVDWCRRANVPCLDLTESLRRSGGPYYYLLDGHYSAAGHQRTAELLAEFLQGYQR